LLPLAFILDLLFLISHVLALFTLVKKQHGPPVVNTQDVNKRSAQIAEPT
jgi:hypothetical protein